MAYNELQEGRLRWVRECQLRWVREWHWQRLCEQRLHRGLQVRWLKAA